METTFDYDSDPDNILVTFKSLGTGRVCTVAIPKEDHDQHTDWVWSDKDDPEPIGLNLVYSPPGYHYQ